MSSCRSKCLNVAIGVVLNIIRFSIGVGIKVKPFSKLLHAIIFHINVTILNETEATHSRRSVGETGTAPSSAELFLIFSGAGPVGQEIDVQSDAGSSSAELGSLRLAWVSGGPSVKDIGLVLKLDPDMVLHDFVHFSHVGDGGESETRHLPFVF